SDLPVLVTSGLSYHRRSATSSTQPQRALVLLSDALEDALAAAAELRTRTPKTLARDARAALLSACVPHAGVVSALEARPCLTISGVELLQRMEDSRDV